MGERPGAERHVERFVTGRGDADRVFSSPLVAEASQIRQLDRHVDEFLRVLREDARQHESAALKQHVKSFERELHDELDLLFRSTKQDLVLYEKILRALARYRDELRSLMGDPSLVSLASSELNYADLLLRTTHDKLDTLFLLFKKLK